MIEERRLEEKDEKINQKLLIKYQYLRNEYNNLLIINKKKKRN
jgi:hypothetical protein